MYDNVWKQKQKSRSWGAKSADIKILKALRGEEWKRGCCQLSRRPNIAALKLQLSALDNRNQKHQKLYEISTRRKYIDLGRWLECQNKRYWVVEFCRKQKGWHIWSHHHASLSFKEPICGLDASEYRNSALQTLAVKWTPCCNNSSSGALSFESVPSSVTKLYVFLKNRLCLILIFCNYTILVT